MNREELIATANAMVAPGKGILAADESTPTIKKRFDTIDLESTDDNRRDYRHMLFTTPGAAEQISGVILFDETLRQTAADGTRLADILNQQGIIPGIKVDKGAKDLFNFPGEKITEGLDGLPARMAEYYDLGARFAKWRAVIDIADGIPTDYAIKANADALARYAVICQEANIVPIVEPEILMDGAHDIARCNDVTRQVLTVVFAELEAAGVVLEGMILKPNMVISGKKCATQADAQTVATMTVDALRATVPTTVPGIVFLSGGQSEADATLHLSLMNQMEGNPWALSFSYGRALQASALKAWGGKADNVAAGQQAFAHRAKCNGLAAKGEYSSSMDA